ncbi:MAG: NACHT domain-containing protein [Candidatus Glassbacteria bacterium]
MSPMVTAGGALVGKELFIKLVLDLYQFIGRKTGQKLKQWNTQRQIESLYKHIGQVRKVKTIWQIDKAVDLADFYCDLHVTLDGKRKKITQLADFETQENVLIQGIAGQGKSILLRYLCSVELSRGEYIPLYLELRKVSAQHGLKDRIYIEFKSLGLDVDDVLFDALADSGKILLLLDAFDEVPDDLKTTVLTAIEDLVASKKKLRVIVTSRPYQNIQMSSHFTVVALDNLRGNEYSEVISKLASGQEWANNLNRHIKTTARHIQDLLCTPLMVTLLVMSFKSYQKLPSKLSDFYDSLFETLLRRHDGTKPGFTRKRGCDLDDSEYRQVFEALCIHAKKTGKQSFNRQSIYKIAQDALKVTNLQAKPSVYIDDIVKITCLLLRDGEEHRFIHKTVQEYYTASFIQKKPELWSRKFYNRMWKSSDYQAWGQELGFLSEIDSYRYNKYYQLPAILAFLGIQEQDLESSEKHIRLPDATSVLNSIVICFTSMNKDTYTIRYILMDDANFLSHRIVNRIVHGGSKIISLAITRAGSKLPKYDFDKLIIGPERTRWLESSDKVVLLSALIKIGVAQEVAAIVKSECEKLFNLAKSIHKSLTVEENPSLLDGLI